MASVRDFFDTDFPRSLRISTSWKGEASGGASFSFEAPITLNYDFEANAKYLVVFVPDCPAPIGVIASFIGKVEGLMHEVGHGIGIAQGHSAGVEDPHDAGALIDTRQFIVYVDADVPKDVRVHLISLAAHRGLAIRIRDRAYARYKTEEQKPVLFISHDSRNKDAIARPLAVELVRHGCPVWFDEFSLKVGDSLRESIERGLRECGKCVLILSPEFLSNDGWTKVEFNSVFQRELLEKQNAVLPVWCGVSKEDIYKYSPQLLDRLAANWDDGLHQVSLKLRQAIGRA